MSILQNAIDSITLGVEDFQSDDPKRLVSSVRNFHAGLLLLIKHKLSLLSVGCDEALIKQRVLPVMENGQVAWKGFGKKTVDFSQIKERCESVGIDVEWGRIEAVQRYRNDIEHYYAAAHAGAVRQQVSNCFVVLRDFIVKHLGTDPRSILGGETWNFLVEEGQVYAAERRTCSEQMDSLKWPNKTAHLWLDAATCNECGSDLIRPRHSAGDRADEKQFECAVCGEGWEYETLLEVAGSPHDSDRRIQDGGGSCVGVCPECSNRGYDAIEEQCVFCGGTGPHVCDRCSNDIPVEELSWDNGSLCGYCAHVSSKDD